MVLYQYGSIHFCFLLTSVWQTFKHSPILSLHSNRHWFSHFFIKPVISDIWFFNLYIFVFPFLHFLRDLKIHLLIRPTHTSLRSKCVKCVLKHILHVFNPMLKMSEGPIIIMSFFPKNYSDEKMLNEERAKYVCNFRCHMPNHLFHKTWYNNL